MDNAQAVDAIALNEDLMRSLIRNTYQDFLIANHIDDDRIKAGEKMIVNELPKHKQDFASEAVERDFDQYELKDYIKKELPDRALVYFQEQYHSLDNANRALYAFEKSYGTAMINKLNEIVDDKLLETIKSNGYQVWGEHQKSALEARKAWYHNQVRAKVGAFINSYSLRRDILIESGSKLYSFALHEIEAALSHTIDRGVWKHDQLVAAKEDVNDLVDRVIEDNWDQEFVKSSLDSLGTELCQLTRDQLINKINDLQNGQEIGNGSDQTVAEQVVTKAVEKAKQSVLDGQEISFQFDDVKNLFNSLVENIVASLSSELLSAYRNNPEVNDLTAFAEDWVSQQSARIIDELNNRLSLLAKGIRQQYLVAVNEAGNSQGHKLTDTQLTDARKLIALKFPTDRSLITSNSSKETVGQEIYDQLVADTPSKVDFMEKARDWFYSAIRGVIHNGLVIWLSKHQLTTDDISALAGSEPGFGPVLDAIASEDLIEEIIEEAYEKNPNSDPIEAARDCLNEIYDQTLAEQYFNSQLASDMVHAAQNILEARCADENIDPAFLGRLSLDTLPWAVQCVRGTIDLNQLAERI